MTVQIKTRVLRSLLVGCSLLTACGLKEPYSEVILLRAPTSITATVDEEAANFRAVEGVIGLRGGSCPGTECSVSVTRLEVATDDFTLPGLDVREPFIRNVGTFVGTKRKDRTLVFDRATFAVELVAIVNGTEAKATLYSHDNPTATLPRGLPQPSVRRRAVPFGAMIS